MNAAPHPLVTLSRAAFLGWFRDKAALFWTLAFPLMFLVIFGLLIPDGGGSKISLGVIGDGPAVSALKASKAFDIETYTDAAKAATSVKDGDLPAYVVVDGNRVTLRYAASDQTTAGTVLGIVDGVVSHLNVAASGQPPAFTLDAHQVEDDSLKSIQYLTPGLLSWALAMGGVFGAALTLVLWRRTQVLRRLRLAPVHAAAILGSRLAVAIVIGFVQAVVFIGVASLPMFGLQLNGQWWWAIPLLALGVVAFFAVGMLVGAFSRTDEAATGAANIVVLPMAFLSGAFFPIEGAPQWLDVVSRCLPMRHLNEGLSGVLVRGQGFDAVWVPALVLMGFTIVIGGIALAVFRWED